ncbi:nickel pincer cofactor biosynthesis protein LarB [Embleya sp. NPDC020886]|uniref:nickel pincer cofactor biosynthesis protein LarB n=1 Tax=Embleya sp. NPDC020886 TaxID=3363980 RepID=UPI0037A8BC3C
MDRAELRELLDRVAAGEAGVDEALDDLVRGPAQGFADLGFARVDTHRELRTGDPEVVFAAGKTPEQTVALFRRLRETSRRPAFATRASADVVDAVRAAFPGETYTDDGGTCVAVGPPPPTRGLVRVVSAGTSDAMVAGEAAFTARLFGAEVERIEDVGVAGIHRLLAVLAELDAADCLIVVAGMEGALPSVVAGLVSVPVLAVPTSVGYGASFGGLAALLAMLNSCAPGVAVCNIDNGFGAGVFAARVARSARGDRTRGTS